jgi:hypothetical protein
MYTVVMARLKSNIQNIVLYAVYCSHECIVYLDKIMSKKNILDIYANLICLTEIKNNSADAFKRPFLPSTNEEIIACDMF